jgi:hypothetical protein
MASLSSWPSPEDFSRCFALVRWLHANGISWSGTAAELTAQLRQDSEATLHFADSDELVAFLESNDDTLRQLGLDSSIRKIPGRPRLIELHITNEGQAPPTGGPVEVVSPLADIEPRLQELETSAPSEATKEKWKSLLPPELIEQLKEPDVQKPLEPVKGPASEPISHLYSLLGLSPEEATYEKPAESNPARAERVFFGDSINSDEESFRSRYLPVLVVAVVTIVLAVAIVVLVRRSSSSSPATAVSTNGAAPETSPSNELDPAEAKEASALLQQASTSKNASAQYDLGMRYKDGRGVQQDYAAALTWLNLARANGNPRAQFEIRSLSPQVSPADAQKARISIGKAFVSGTNVPRNYVIAHNWFSVAELAGSSEASALRKQIEGKMSQGQLQRARTGR